MTRSSYRPAHLLAAAAIVTALLAPAAYAEERTEPRPGQTQVLRQLYTSGLARMARGDPASAVSVFRVGAEVAPELPQMQYAYGLAQILAYWPGREQALPAVRKAHTLDPAQPLYAVAVVFADPALSELGTDGALYLTGTAVERLRSASSQLDASRTAINGRYLANVLASLQSTGDTRYPMRLADFDRMLGQGGKFRLPTWTDGQAFARLFAVSITDAEFQSFEPRMIARLQKGLESLTPESLRQVRMKARANRMREQTSQDSEEVLLLENG